MLAITRGVSRAIAECELTFVEREPIDYDRAAAQHARYVETLRTVGCHTRTIPADDELPDCVFIEDTAIVLDEVAIITRPGAESRRPETIAVAEVLASLRPLEHIEAPATLDGGDVLRVGRRIYVGLSTRTNIEALGQLSRFVEPHGYEVVPVSVGGSLHLKTAVTQIADDLLLINREWIDPDVFGAGMRFVHIDASEPFAANAVRIGERLLYADSYPRTLARIREHGIDVVTVDATELAKAEGGVTCCSLLLRA